ncbi:hypothetical protein ACN2AU_10325 [Aerococcus viridans]
MKKSTNFWGVLRQNTLLIMCELLIIFGKNFIKEERKKIKKEAKKEVAKNIQKLINIVFYIKKSIIQVIENAHKGE